MGSVGGVGEQCRLFGGHRGGEPMNVQDAYTEAKAAFRTAAGLRLYASWDAHGLLEELAAALNMTVGEHLVEIKANTNLLPYTPEKFAKAVQLAAVAVLRWQRESKAQAPQPKDRTVYVQPKKHYWCHGEGCHHCNYTGWSH